MNARSLFTLTLRAALPAVWLATLAPAPAQDDKKPDDKKPEETKPDEKKPEEKPATDKPATDSDGKPPALPAVDLANPALLGQRGDEAYTKGDWLNAAANYKGLYTIGIRTSAPPVMMEPLIFTLGVCLFNLPNYEEAIKTFEEYVSKFPSGQYVSRAQLGIARCFRSQKKYPEAIKRYEPLKKDVTLKDEVNIELADCFKENDQKDKAIVLLETALATGIKTSPDARQALYLVDLYQADSPEKGVAMLDRLKKSPGNRPLVAEINYAALKLADSLMTDMKYEDALRAYQNLRKKKEVLATLKDLRDDYDRVIKSVSARIGPSHPDSIRNQRTLEATKMYDGFAKQMVEMLTKEQSYDAVVFYRIGRCFAYLERFWEARLAFQYVLDHFPQFEDKANVLYSVALCHYNLTPRDLSQDGLKFADKTEQMCRKYLTDFPNNAEASQVAEILITVATRSSDPVKINKVYEEVMDLIKDSPNKFVFLATQVQSYLEQYDFDKARDAADKFLNAAPKDDPMREAVEYMRSLTYFFKNDYNGAMAELKKYVAAYPSGNYIPDAKYRLAFLVMGEERLNKSKKRTSTFRNVIAEAQHIIDSHPGTSSVADSYALQGDAYKELTGDELQEAGWSNEERNQKMASVYMSAVQQAQSDQVAEYSLTQAAPLLRAQDRWGDVIKMYEDFRRMWPQHRIAIQSVGEICKAIVARTNGLYEKEIAEAKDEAERLKFLAQRTEEKAKAQTQAREYLATTILENVNNPQKEGVEDLMQQLALMAVPKQKRAPAPAPATPPASSGVSTAAATPPAPAKRAERISVAELGRLAEAELDRLLVADKLTNIGKARLVYVKCQLYKMLEMNAPKKGADGKPIGPDGKPLAETGPKRSDALMQQLVTEYKPEDYSSALLALVGDTHFQTGDREKATACYNRLLQFFPKSLFLDWGAVGLGQMAFEDKDYEMALKKFKLAAEEYIGSKYGEAQMGKARTLIALEQFGDPEKNAENSPEKILLGIIGDKTYPKEIQAEATWQLGELKFKQQDYAGAYNYFWRLPLSFAKWPEWVAKGYLRAGEAKEALGKMSDAKDLYNLPMTNPKLQEKLKGQPDYEKIKERYRRL